MDGIAIKVENVSKNFVLPHERASSVKSLFVSPFKKRLKNNKEIQHTLKDISFEVKKGEFFGIVGRNGSGKSTMLKILAGIYQPNIGKTTVNGRLVPFIELGVGFNPELTGRENVYLNGALLGFSQKDVDKKYSSIVGFAELERFMDQKLKNYSSGMQVRLAFSVATILAESDILLIDEVLAVGDADFQRKCFEYFKKLKKDNKTVVFVSHDMSAIREYCDKAVLIDSGRLIAVGDADKVSQEYTRLFTKTDTANGENLPGKRWGNGQIKTQNIDIDVTEQEITIRQTLKSKVSTINPVVGFRIKDATGKEIMGTNTKIENKKLGETMLPKSVIVIWKFPNVLSDGKYTVDPAVICPDEVTVADWWDDAAEFSIKKPRRVPYIIDPGFKIKVENE